MRSFCPQFDDFYHNMKSLIPQQIKFNINLSAPMNQYFIQIIPVDLPSLSLSDALDPIQRCFLRILKLYEPNDSDLKMSSQDLTLLD